MMTYRMYASCTATTTTTVTCSKKSSVAPLNSLVSVHQRSMASSKSKIPEFDLKEVEAAQDIEKDLQELFQMEHDRLAARLHEFTALKDAVTNNGFTVCSPSVSSVIATSRVVHLDAFVTHQSWW
jgi:hypothetical protein